MNWKDLTIGDLVNDAMVEIQTGPFGTQLRASDYSDSGVPVINVRNIGYGNLRQDKLEFVPDTVVERLQQHILRKNDIVFGRKGAVDRHLLVSENEDGWIQGSDCIRLRILSEKINPRFISYQFCIDSHKQWMLTQCSNKSTMASLNQEVIKRIPLRIPEVSEQNKIVDVLSNYDDLIENTKRRISLLEQTARLIFKEWFVHFRFPGHEDVKIIDGVPAGWRKVFVPDIIEINPAERVEKGKEIRYVPMSSLSETGMTINLREVENRDKPTSVKFRNGDTLLARITPCLENGKTAYVNFLQQDEVACGSTEFIVLRGRRVSSYFVYCLARTYEFREHAIKSMIGSSGRQRVQISCFNEFQLVLPPTSLLEQFNEIARNCFETIANLQRQNDLLIEARDLLLPRLLKGEIQL